MPTIKTKKRMNKKEYAQFLIDNAEIIEITASYRGEEKYEQNIKLEPNNNKTIPISKDILEIEIEEPITEVMKFQHTVERFISSYVNEYRYATHDNKSIKDILNNRPPHVETTHIYAEVENELMLIWKNGKLVE